MKPRRVSAPTKVVHPLRSYPMAMRDADAQSLAAATAAMPARHVGGRPRFIDEDQFFRVQVQLILEPGLTTLQHVGAVLFAGVRGLFLRVTPCRAKNRWIVPKPKARPFAARLARTSSMVASRSGPSAARTIS